MCGRTACTLGPNDLVKRCASDTLPKTSAQRAVKWVENKHSGHDYVTSYNKAPGSVCPVLVARRHLPKDVVVNELDASVASTQKEEAAKGEAGDDICIFPMLWGLVPSWFEGHPQKTGLSTNNCRSEGMFEKRMFSESLRRHRRCVVVVDGFYEWKTTTHKDSKPAIINAKKSTTAKQPYFIFAGKNCDVGGDLNRADVVETEGSTTDSTSSQSCDSPSSTRRKVDESISHSPLIKDDVSPPSKLDDKNCVSASTCVQDNEKIFVSSLMNDGSSQLPKAVENSCDSKAYSSLEDEKNSKSPSTKEDSSRSTTEDSSRSTKEDSSRSTKEDSSRSTKEDSSRSTKEDSSRSVKEDSSISTKEDSSRSSRLLAIAGLFCVASPRDGDGRDSNNPLYSYSVITVSSAPSLKWLHDRQPAVLTTEEEILSWLRDGELTKNQVEQLIRPVDNLQFHPVSTMVNNARINDEKCMEPIDLKEEEEKKKPKPNALTNWLAKGTASSGASSTSGLSSISCANSNGAETKKPKKGFMTSWLAKGKRQAESEGKDPKRLKIE